MSDRLPLPAIEGSRYERLTNRWVCGDPAGCPLGPDRKGHCRRDSSSPRCLPARSVRARRGLYSLVAVAATTACLLVLLGGSWGTGFINPGPLSAPHASLAFGTNHFKGGKSECAACHTTAAAGLSGWTRAAVEANPGPFDFNKLGATLPPNMGSIETACLKCHQNFDQHQPNVVRNLHCTTCHPEHVGTGPMKLATSKDCILCHGNAAIMTAASAKGSALAEELFERSYSHRMFPIARPKSGHTAVFQSFASDHPEFQVRQANLRESGNTLLFNHNEHLTKGYVYPPGTSRQGQRAGCADCHEPDANVFLHKRISFERHCASCHPLQFDPATENLVLPHGAPELVRAFVHSLPKPYDDYARTNNLATEPSEFVADRMTNLYRRLGLNPGQSGWQDKLEAEIFASDRQHRPFHDAGRLGTVGRSEFQGCQKCHAVTSSGDRLPQITAPVMPERWMRHSRFNHATHSRVDCAQCHVDGKSPANSAPHSRDTADILLPSKAACVDCHNPRGTASDSCMTCHKYHRAPADAKFAKP